jgi:hypothetical protein
MHMPAALSSVFCPDAAEKLGTFILIGRISAAIGNAFLDAIIFKLMTSVSLQHFLTILPGCLDSLRQFKQIHHAEQRPTRSHNHERIHRSGIGPSGWHGVQMAVIVVKPNPVFAPVLTKSHDFEFLPKQRMVRMGYSETSTFKVVMRRI